MSLFKQTIKMNLYYILTIKLSIIAYNIFAVFCLIDILSFIISIIQFLSMYSCSWNSLYENKIVISNLTISYRIFKIIKFLHFMTNIITGSSQKISFYNTFNKRINIYYTQHQCKVLLLEFFIILLTIISDLFILINFY